MKRFFLQRSLPRYEGSLLGAKGTGSSNGQQISTEMTVGKCKNRPPVMRSLQYTTGLFPS